MKLYRLAKSNVWEKYPESVQNRAGEVRARGRYEDRSREKTLALCEKCGKEAVYSKEMHPDSDINYMARICEHCGEL